MQSTEGAHQPIPLACVPGAIPEGERAAHFALIAELFAGARGRRRELSNGYKFSFGAEAYDAVTRFVGNERRCCPFLRFSIDVSADGGPIALSLMGPDGTTAFLDAELPA